MMTVDKRNRVTADTQAKAGILIEALPFLKNFGGKRLVIKVGGELLDNEEASASFAQDLILLKSVGIQIVLLHGGGPQISRAMEKLGKKPEFKNGLRVTDQETMKIMSMVLLGDLNIKLVSLLNVHGPKSVGFSGADGNLFSVEQESPELGFVGKLKNINTDLVIKTLENGYMPVIGSVGVDDEGQAYNINVDLAAGNLAGALGAEKLIVLSNVEGLYETFGDENSLIPEIKAKGLRKMKESGSLTAGMIPKVDGILAALDGGVKRAHILDGRVEHAVLLEIFTPEGIGTMIFRDGSE